MLSKGIVTGSKDGLFYVWSKELDREILVDRRRTSTVNETIPSVGSWIVFSLENGSTVGEFTEIPELLPTKVDRQGTVMLKTRISFPSNSIYRCDLLAHSEHLGNIGIFRDVPNLSKDYEYDAWVERFLIQLFVFFEKYDAVGCFMKFSALRTVPRPRRT
ncbi:unnamed protein product [Gongylonema pulchrum]|uniref:WD_REPEATS_REGION domain-containing protein n=1 Tax=Gongylonema pulchrum TaxID=637853 RepID=A0A183D4S3_9BILA|nr:unnamed protein product [Gongylonema pulchrum]